MKKNAFRALAVALSLSAAAPVTAGQQPGPTMDQTKTWLETEGRDLMRANRLLDDRPHFALSAGTDAVEMLMFDQCRLIWRMVTTTRVTTITGTGRQAGATTTRRYDVVVPLSDLGSITVAPDMRLTDNPVYQVRLGIRNPTDGTSTISVDSDNPYPIWSTGLPAQTVEDAQRIAQAVTHASALCGVVRGGVF